MLLKLVLSESIYMNNDLDSYKFDVKVFILLYVGPHCAFSFLYMLFLDAI